MTPTSAQHRRMHVLWRFAGVTDRADRLALTSAIVRRHLTTSNDLEEWEAAGVIRYMQRMDDRGELFGRAQAWLARYRAVVS